MKTNLSSRNSSLWTPTRTVGSLVLALALNSCTPTSDTVYLVYNFSGKPIMAGTVQDTGGGHAAMDSGIPDQAMWPVGWAPWRRLRHGASVTIDWIGGEGRARWYRVTVPIQIEQAKGRDLEIYFRPDQLVCASLVDDAHRTRLTEKAPPARLGTPAAKLSCAKPEELPRLAAGQAAGFEQDAVSHSWELYDRKGTSTLIFQKLAHATGPVKFRYGTMLKGQTRYLDEFYSVRMIGKQAAWLVKAPLDPGVPGIYLVTGDSTGWKSRFLGRVDSEEEHLSATRILIGKQMVVDIDTADVFMLPKFVGIDYWILGLSKDGQHLAVYWQQERSVRPDGRQFGIAMLNLETGREAEAAVPSIPGLPPRQMIYQFYGDWYRDHCDWTPLLSCK